MALGKHEEAKEWVGMFLLYNDNVSARRRFYQVLDIVLDITLREDLELQNYTPSLTRMYGEEILDNVTASMSEEIRFFGLMPTNMKLDGIEKHLMLIKSYKKLQDARYRHHVSTSL